MTSTGRVRPKIQLYHHPQSILDLIWSGCDLAEDGEEKGAACGEYLSEVQGAMRDFCKGMTAQSDAVSLETEHLNLTVQKTNSRHVLVHSERFIWDGYLVPTTYQDM